MVERLIQRYDLRKDKIHQRLQIAKLHGRRGSDLAVTTDFRSVLTEVISSSIGLTDSEKVVRVFP